MKKCVLKINVTILNIKKKKQFFYNLGLLNYKKNII